MDREAVVQAVVGVVGTALFVAAALLIATMYTEEGTGSGQLLSETGGQVMVAAIAGFVVVMSLLGYAATRRAA